MGFPYEPHHSFTLDLLPHRLAVCRLEPGSALPQSLLRAPFVAITRTSEELSLVVPEELVEDHWIVEPGWWALAVRGPLDFELVGVLASLAGTLAAAQVSLFAISTYDTDLLLVKDDDCERGVAALEAAGHVVERPKES